MRPLTLEIHGTGTHNRGAELMSIAIAERMRSSFPGVRIVVPPDYASYESRARHGFLTTWEFPGRFRTQTMARLTPKVVLRTGGIINPGEVDVVLDASGFAFSDQWGPNPARKLVNKMNRRLRKKQLLVLLPQAFGPFKNPEVSKWTRLLLGRSSLVCARDEHSLNELRALNTPTDVRLFPDFTVGVKPQPDPSMTLPSEFVAIVPNKRMLDKGESDFAYLHFLQQSVTSLLTLGLNPVFVLHDAYEDREVLARLEGAARSVPVFEHDDPRVLKWILGKATFVVASRFHALVSALSQGIPCIGAGWSHKYPELFASFDCPDFLVSDLHHPAALEVVLNRLQTPENRRIQSERILTASGRIKQQNDSMWSEVFDLFERLPG